MDSTKTSGIILVPPWVRQCRSVKNGCRPRAFALMPSPYGGALYSCHRCHYRSIKTVAEASSGSQQSNAGRNLLPTAFRKIQETGSHGRGSQQRGWFFLLIKWTLLGHPLIEGLLYKTLAIRTLKRPLYKTSIWGGLRGCVFGRFLGPLHARARHQSKIPESQETRPQERGAGQEGFPPLGSLCELGKRKHS
jgi:hypothetical protein